MAQDTLAPDGYTLVYLFRNGGSVTVPRKFDSITHAEAYFRCLKDADTENRIIGYKIYTK